MKGSRRRSIFAANLVNSAAAGEQPQVLDDLRRAILSGDEPPGTMIPIDAVARVFGVSQIPVREALKALLGEGLVEHVPNVGYSVAKLTFQEFREMYDVRRALEAAALRSAAIFATREDDVQVASAQQEMRDVLDRHDEKLYHATSRRFHMAMIRASRMDRLVHMYESAWNMTEPARPMSRVPADERRCFSDEHERLAIAFFDRDADRLVRESEAHYQHLATALAGLASDEAVFRIPS